MENVYYSPEKWDLVPVAEIDYYDEPYEFDIRVVWQYKDGTFYSAHDTGCSCPTPFEDFGSLEELDKITSIEDLRKLVIDETYGGNIESPEIVDFLRKVEAVLV